MPLELNAYSFNARTDYLGSSWLKKAIDFYQTGFSVEPLTLGRVHRFNFKASPEKESSVPLSK